MYGNEIFMICLTVYFIKCERWNYLVIDSSNSPDQFMKVLFVHNILS